MASLIKGEFLEVRLMYSQFGVPVCVVGDEENGKMNLFVSGTRAEDTFFSLMESDLPTSLRLLRSLGFKSMTEDDKRSFLNGV